MKTFTVNGENQYINCQIDSDEKPLDWDLGGFVPTINKSDKFKATKSGYPAITNARFNPEKLIHCDMYTESLNVTKYRDSEYETDSKLGQGSSGSCLYAKNFNRWLQHQGDDVLTDTINL